MLNLPAAICRRVDDVDGLRNSLVERLLRANRVIDQSARLAAAEEREEWNDREAVVRRPAILLQRIDGADRPANALEGPLRDQDAIALHFSNSVRRLVAA